MAAAIAAGRGRREIVSPAILIYDMMHQHNTIAEIKIRLPVFVIARKKNAKNWIVHCQKYCCTVVGSSA